MATGDTILASQYNSWWTSLNNIRTSWDTPGTAVAVTTASVGQTAQATTMNALINQVNALASFYSGADWANFTESTKAVGEIIRWPSKMVYMLNYLSGVCAFNSTNSFQSTFTNFSDFADFADFSDNSTNSFNSTFSNFSDNGTFSDFGDFSDNGTNSNFSDFSDNGTNSNFSDFSNRSNFSTNTTESGGQSVRVGFSYSCNNNGTCGSY